MGESSEQKSVIVVCPICRARAESGCLYGSDRAPLRWLPGEASWENNLSTASGDGDWVGKNELLSGTYAEGIRCLSCHAIILRYEPKA